MNLFFEKIERFFERIKQMNVIKVFLITWGINFAWTVFVGMILFFSGVEFSQHVASSSEFTNSFLLVPFAAVAEEALFRWSPMLLLTFGLTYCYKIGKISKTQFFHWERYLLLIIVVVSCIIFGWVHGNIFNVLMQGISGMFMYIIYLRAFFIERDRGIRDRWQVLPIVESSLYHTMANAFLIFL